MDGQGHEAVKSWLTDYRSAGYSARRARERQFGMKTTEAVQTWVARDLEFLAGVEVAVIRDDEDGYPPRLATLLAESRPGMLFCAGETDLLSRSIVSVCGARDTSEHGLELARRCAHILAELDVCVSSGYARGVDRAAHTGALDAGGGTVALLPYGLKKFVWKTSLGEECCHERFLAASELPPTCGFSTTAAFRRNTMLAALARAVIVVEPGASGGSWFTAKRAAALGTPLFFLEGERPDSIERLEAMGGKRITVKNHAPRVDDVMHVLELSS